MGIPRLFTGFTRSGERAGPWAGRRRRGLRFPIEQEVHYRVLKPETVEVGVGRTINMSSSGVLFTAQRSLALGERLELAIDWPAELDNGCGLRLVTAGRVMRSEGLRAAVAVEHYEFRTRRSARTLKAFPAESLVGRPRSGQAP